METNKQKKNFGAREIEVLRKRNGEELALSVLWTEWLGDQHPFVEMVGHYRRKGTDFHYFCDLFFHHYPKYNLPSS